MPWIEINQTPPSPKYFTTRDCEICGRDTRRENKSICDECRDKLYKLLYAEGGKP